MKIRCDACKGQKRVYGAGMITTYECKTCKGVGEVERELTIVTSDEPAYKEELKKASERLRKKEKELPIDEKEVA